MSDTITDGEVFTINLIERVGSVFSLLGCLFIIGTFTLSKLFHKPINRLVFYASFGNMMTNIGTLIARSYVSDQDSFGCQFQGLLIQMFLPADACWTLAMAVNVYLTFYHKFDAERLRKMELSYLILCYGIPFVPGFSYIFIRNSSGQRMYGNATLWCWITQDWDIFRIATFYGPVWVIILVTFFIYIRAGRTIYEKRKQLRSFSNHEPDHVMMNDTFGSVKTTEVSVTSEIAQLPTTVLGISSPGRRRDLEATGGTGAGSSSPPGPQPLPGAYSVTISSDRRNRRESGAQAGEAASPRSTMPSAARANNLSRRNTYELNNAAWSYTKCAILFFTALLITWIPSSANRVYSVVHAGKISLPLEYMSALVLPLQGFWNAIIYMVTSWTAVKTVVSTMLDHVCCRRQEPRGAAKLPEYLRDSHGSDRRATNNNKPYETESTTELANCRVSSKEEGSE